MNAIEFVKIVEARLGWMPPSSHNVRMGHTRYVAEAAKVKRKAATKPDLYTWDNLLLAVELLVRERQPRTPVGVFAHVERALAMAVEVEDDLETAIRDATAYEVQRGDPDGWETRFARAVGHYRSLALAEWKESIK